MPTAINRWAWAAGLVLLLTTAATLASIERTPLPDVDETYIISASAAVSRGATGVPRVLDPGPWNVEFPRVYGPTFFWLSSALIHVFGLSATSARLACLIGALVAAMAGGWLVRRTGGSVQWAILAAALIWLSPPIGTAATNGRMDSLAVSLELLALALIVIPDDVGPSAAAASGVASGVCLCLALLCTPRALLFGVAFPSAVLVTGLVRRPSPRGATIAVSAACLACGAGFLVWLHTLGVSPLHWVRDSIAGAQSDGFNSVLPGRSRVWSVSGVSLLSALTAAWILSVSAVQGWRAQLAVPWMVVLVAVWTMGNAAGYVLRVNHTFFRDIYFVTPVLAAALAWSAAVAARRREGLGPIVASWMVVLTIFAGGRLLKFAEVADTWEQRDPSPIEAFFRTNVPPGSVIFGFDQFYFYAIEGSGSHFRTFSSMVPFAGSPTIGRPPASMVSALTREMVGQYFVWPDDDDHFPLPEGLRCLDPGKVAAFVPPPRARHAFAWVPQFARYGYFHGYPKTNVYRVPAGCPAG